MAYSKTFLLLGLAFAVVVLVASQVSARELAETTTSESQTSKCLHSRNDLTLLKIL